jgi:hypothetical protein
MQLGENLNMFQVQYDAAEFFPEIDSRFLFYLVSQPSSQDSSKRVLKMHKHLKEELETLRESIKMLRFTNIVNVWIPRFEK